MSVCHVWRIRACVDFMQNSFFFLLLNAFVVVAGCYYYFIWVDFFFTFIGCFCCYFDNWVFSEHTNSTHNALYSTRITLNRCHTKRNENQKQKIEKKWYLEKQNKHKIFKNRCTLGTEKRFVLIAFFCRFKFYVLLFRSLFFFLNIKTCVLYRKLSNSFYTCDPSVGAPQTIHFFCFRCEWITLFRFVTVDRLSWRSYRLRLCTTTEYVNNNWAARLASFCSFSHFFSCSPCLQCAIGLCICALAYGKCAVEDVCVHECGSWRHCL